MIPVRAADEQPLIAILHSNAGVTEKCAACQQLRLVGTVQAVPALAGLLNDERTSHAARYALAAIHAPAAGAALRDALDRSSGLIRLGLIDSLGWRGETEDVPRLMPLLVGADDATASAAAIALGRIGGLSAVTALTAAQKQATPVVQLACVEGLLSCAERLRTADDNSTAARIYRSLWETSMPPHLRAAAWSGLVWSTPDQRAQLLSEALTGTDLPTRRVALKLVRELRDRRVIAACLRQWDSLPAEAQLAVLDAQVQFGGEALSTVRLATGSSNVDVRVAAWQALAELNDASSVPALAQAAARGEAIESDAARKTLARLHGAEASERLLACLTESAPSEQAVLLAVLGERGATETVEVLLQHATFERPAPVRVAALESLGQLAVAETLAPLLDLITVSPSESESAPVLKALHDVSQASPDRSQSTRLILETAESLPVARRRQLLPLLAGLATPDGLTALQATTREADPELAREAVRVLAQWPSAAPAPYLLELARTTNDPTLQTLALRGSIELIALEPDSDAQLVALRQALSLASRVEERKQALGRIGEIPTAEALQIALAALAEPDLASEAGLAAVNIAEKLAPSNRQLANDAADQVLARCETAEIVRRAWALRTGPAGPGPFIRDWRVAGPYRRPEVVGAQAVFEIEFAPEQSSELAGWKTVPPDDMINLAALFPGELNCAAYLKTRLTVPEPCRAALLLGSDDGVKAWLNGVVIHSNNVDRGAVPDQDMALIELEPGANDLLLKVTQGGGGWAVCARIVGLDGTPIAGLKIEPPTDTP